MTGALVIAVACGVCAVRSASAEVNYTYVSSGGEAAGLPGQTVTVPLYLEEDAFGGSSPLLSNNGGLASAGMQIVRRQGNASITAATLDTSDFTGSSSESALPGNTFSFSESVTAGAPGVLPGNTGGGMNPFVHSNQVYLGSIDITLAAAPVDSVFDFGPLQPPGGHTIDQAGHDLDISSSNPAYTGASDLSPTVFPVLVEVIMPEPSLLGALGIVALAALPRRR